MMFTFHCDKLLILLTLFTLTACDASLEGNTPARSVDQLENKKIEAFRIDLLKLGFDTASAIQIQPHIKDRSRTQQLVVMACMDLDQPRLALEFAHQIQNWRRGACLADLAFYSVEKGYTDGVEAYLKQAEGAVKTAEQEWRRDQVNVKIARTYALLKEAEKTAKFATNVVESEQGKVVAVVAANDLENYEQILTVIDALAASTQFEVIRNAQQAYLELYAKHFADASRRATIEQRLRKSWAKFPQGIVVDLLLKLGEAALAGGDASQGLAFVNEAHDLLVKMEWQVDTGHHIPVLARVGSLRYRCGEKEKGLADLDAARARFEADVEKIVNIYRAGSLRPLAEAYQAVGETKASLAVYKLAVEQGMVNPNSRPRAEDLAATCASMALRGVEPDAALWARLREIRAGLRDPW